jgi:hypothetical protein
MGCRNLSVQGKLDSLLRMKSFRPEIPMDGLDLNNWHAAGH